MNINCTTGNIELYLKEGKNPAACGGSITFTCKANNTNAVSIVKNGILCQSFERSGSTGPNNCSRDLSIELVSAVANPSNRFITIFEIDGQHYFEDDKEEVTVECKDAMGTAKILTLQVNSKFLPLRLSLLFFFKKVDLVILYLNAHTTAQTAPEVAMMVFRFKYRNHVMGLKITWWWD